MLRPPVAAVGAFVWGVTFLRCGSAAAGQEPAPPPPPQEVVLARPVRFEPPPPPEPRSSFTFSAGYAQLETDGDLLDDVEGYYFDSEFSFKIRPDAPLWAGISLNGSYFSESEDTDVGGVIPTEVEVDAELSTFCIEPRLTFVVLPRRERGPYLAGKIGAGLLIADYWATRVVERPSGFFVDGDGDTTFAFAIRPGAQVGYSGGPWVLGAEVYEMWAWGDFDELGDQLNELRIGVFFTMRY